jgi:hypothetical protein
MTVGHQHRRAEYSEWIGEGQLRWRKNDVRLGLSVTTPLADPLKYPSQKNPTVSVSFAGRMGRSFEACLSREPLWAKPVLVVSAVSFKETGPLLLLSFLFSFFISLHLNLV